MDYLFPGAFRLLLATIVVQHHYGSYALGTMAVLIFFMLSGYWIYQMYDRKYSYAGRPYLTFIGSRLWRLLPVFYLANLGTIAVTSACGRHLGPASLRGIVANLTLLGYASAPRANTPLGPAWSLDIELQFYLVAPIIVTFLKRSATLAPILLALLGTFGALLFLWGRSNWLLDYCGFFFVGTLCAHYRLRPSKAWAGGSMLLWVVAILVLPMIPATRSIMIGGKAPSIEFVRYNDLANVLLTIVAIPLAFWTVHLKSPWIDRMAGDLSYVVYLFHISGFLIVHHFWGVLPRNDRLPYVLASVVVTYGVSLLVLWFYDRPIDRLRDRFVERRLHEDSSSIETATGPGSIITLARQGEAVTELS